MDFFEALENVGLGRDALFEAAVEVLEQDVDAVEVVEQDDEFLEICVDVGLGIFVQKKQVLVQE